MEKIKETLKKHPALYAVIGIIIGVIVTTLIIIILNTLDYKEKNSSNSKNPEVETKTNKKASIEDDKDQSPLEENTNITTPETNDSIKNNNEVSTNKDETIINYLNEQTESINNGAESDVSLRDKIKTSFANIYNFIFNGSTIKGITFKELRTETKLKERISYVARPDSITTSEGDFLATHVAIKKLKVLEKSIELDYKIDQKFPNYKDNIKDKYHDLKEKAVSTYLNMTEDICTNNESLCTTAKENFNTMKNSFAITYDYIKEKAKSGSEKLKEWLKNR